MKTLIIPCAGGDYLNGVPRYLAVHPDGKILVRKCIDGLGMDLFDRIIIPIVKSDDESFNAEASIREAFADQQHMEVIKLPEYTSGPAETIYRTVISAGVTGSVAIKDSDNYLRPMEMKCGNFIAGLNLNEWDSDVYNLRNKSFLILNEQKQILDVFEKQLKSDVISVGLYGFAEASDFLFAYERLNDKSYPMSRLYISHIISYLIGYSQKVFYYAPCVEYENWGSSKEWNDVQKKYATYFVELDSLQMDADTVQRLRKIQSSGAVLIGFTARSHEVGKSIRKSFAESGLHFSDIVCNCGFSNIKKILDSSRQLDNADIES